MTLFNPFGDHDVAARRLPDGGAVQRSPLYAAPPRHARPMRRLPALLLALTFLPAAPARAQDAPGPDHARAHEPRANDRRDILVTGHRPDACDPAAARAAIDYACLNGALKSAATAAQPTPPAVDATTAQATTPSRVGTFSHAATAQRMGKNFGHSAQPYRPPAPTYTNPVRGAGPQ